MSVLRRAFALGLLLALPAGAGADEGRTGEARAAVKKAAEALKAGEPAKALAELERAEALAPLDRIAYARGRCYEVLGDVGRALERYREYLAVGADAGLMGRAEASVQRLGRQKTGSLTVKCSVDGARVTLGGFEEGPCPWRLAGLRAGEYDLAVSAPRHAPVRQRLRVRPDAPTRFEAKLQPLPGRLSVRGSAGTALVDGKAVGEIPLAGLELPPGPHRLVVKRDGEPDWSTEIGVGAGLDTTVEVVPGEAPGGLVVQSAPAGATVLVDGREVGVTPWGPHPLPAGSHAVRLRKPGYGPSGSTVEVRPGAFFRLSLKLAEAKGVLAVSARPPDAQVHLDGRLVGRVPVEVETTVGARRVLVTAQGFRPLERRVEIQADQTARLKLRLWPGKGSLVVTSDPPGADVEVDGKAAGRTPTEPVRLVSGTHEVRVTAPRSPPWTGSTFVPHASTQTVHATLESDDLPLVLGGAAGASALAAAGMLVWTLSAADDLDAAAAHYDAAPTEAAAGAAGDELDSARTKAVWLRASTQALGVAAAVLAAGSLWAWLSPAPAPDEEAALGPSVGPGVVSFGGRW